VQRLRNPDDPCPYGICDGDGFEVDEATNTARPCRCRPERVALRKTRRMEGDLRRAVPRRYRDLAPDRYPVPEIAQQHPTAFRIVKRYMDTMTARLERGDGLWLYGNKGTGKTTLAYLVAATAARAGHTVLSWNTITLLNDLRESFDADSTQRTQDIVDAACSVDLLQLEDLSAARPTEWTLEQLYLVINRRYEEQRAIVITSDLPDGEAPDPDRLAEHIGPRTHSRIIEMCGDPVTMIGSDMRREYRPPMEEREPAAPPEPAPAPAPVRPRDPEPAQTSLSDGFGRRAASSGSANLDWR